MSCNGLSQNGHVEVRGLSSETNKCAVFAKHVAEAAFFAFVLRF